YTHRHELIECREVILGQFQTFLRQQDLEKGILNVEHQRAGGVEQLHLGDLLRLLGHLDPSLPLVAALKDEISADRILRRAGAVGIVESRSKQIEVISTDTQNRVGPQLRGSDAGIGNAQVISLRKQAEIFLNRFLDSLVDGYCCWLL